MAHGVKPYGRTEAQNTVFGVQDMGELAARLWSPNTFNRLGNTVFMDGFEGSLNKWRIATGGVGAAVAVSNARQRNGLCSCLLTGGGPGGGWAAIAHDEPYPALSSFGFEVSVSGFTNVGEFWVTMGIYFNLFIQEFSVRWNSVGNIFEYLGAGGAWTPFGAGVLYGEHTLFHTFKLVVDAVAGVYRYVVVDNAAYNLAGIAPNNPGTLLPDHIMIQAYSQSVAAGISEAWVDDVILTQNEP